MINAAESQNINHSQIQSNQFAAQVHDQELFTTMQEVLKKNKEKVIIEEKKDEEEEEEKQGEDKELLTKSVGLSKSVIQRRLNFKKLHEEFINIFNKENSNINDCRRCLIHMIVLVGVLNCCAWEIDCLFFNICYGEYIEMKKWISISLFPVIIVSIFLLYILFDSINYLRRKIILACIIIYFILSLFLIILGIFSISYGAKYSIDDASSQLKTLTDNEQEYYKELHKKNKEENLKHEYFIKMVASGVIDIILGFSGFLVSVLTIFFTSLLSKTAFDWRPPLRSHIRPPRVRKAIELYNQNYDSYLNLFRAENPSYQMDEIEAKESKNRFGGIKASVLGRGIGDSVIKEKKESENDKDSIIKKSKKKKKLDKSEDSKDKKKEDEDSDELPKPKIKKKKKVLNRIIDNSSDKDKDKNDENKKSNENNNVNNHVDNHVDNHINNHIEEINTDIKDNKDEI